MCVFPGTRFGCPPPPYLVGEQLHHWRKCIIRTPIVVFIYKIRMSLKYHEQRLESVLSNAMSCAVNHRVVLLTFISASFLQELVNYVSVIITHQRCQPIQPVRPDPLSRRCLYVGCEDMRSCCAFPAYDNIYTSNDPYLHMQHRARLI